MSARRLQLIQRIDCLKSNWYLWECEDEQGRKGTVQADFGGELVADETFELD